MLPSGSHALEGDCTHYAAKDGSEASSSDNASPPLSLIYEQVVAPLRAAYGQNSADQQQDLKSPASVTSPKKPHASEPNALLSSPKAPSLSASSPATSVDASPQSLPPANSIGNSCAIASSGSSAGESSHEAFYNNGRHPIHRARVNHWGLHKSTMAPPQRGESHRHRQPSTRDTLQQNTQSHTQFRFPQPNTRASTELDTLPSRTQKKNRFVEYPPSSQDQYPVGGEKIYRPVHSPSRPIEFADQLDLYHEDTVLFEQELIPQAQKRDRAYREALRIDWRLTERKFELEKVMEAHMRKPPAQRPDIHPWLVAEKLAIANLENHLQSHVDNATKEQKALEAIIVTTFTPTAERSFKEVTPEQASVLYEARLLPQRHPLMSKKVNRGLGAIPPTPKSKTAPVDRQVMNQARSRSSRGAKTPLWKQWEQMPKPGSN